MMLQVTIGLVQNSLRDPTSPRVVLGPGEEVEVTLFIPQSPLTLLVEFLKLVGSLIFVFRAKKPNHSTTNTTTSRPITPLPRILNQEPSTRGDSVDLLDDEEKAAFLPRSARTNSYSHTRNHSHSYSRRPPSVVRHHRRFSATSPLDNISNTPTSENTFKYPPEPPRGHRDHTLRPSSSPVSATRSIKEDEDEDIPSRLRTNDNGFQIALDGRTSGLLGGLALLYTLRDQAVSSYFEFPDLRPGFLMPKLSRPSSPHNSPTSELYISSVCALSSSPVSKVSCSSGVLSTFNNGPQPCFKYVLSFVTSRCNVMFTSHVSYPLCS